MTDRLVLLDVLDSLSPGIGKRALLDQMRNVQFTGQEAIGFNDQIVVIAPYVTDFTCSVDYEGLHKILTRIANQEVSLSIDGARLVITSDRLKAGLESLESEEFQNRLNTALAQLPKEFNPIPEDFSTAVALCAPTAATDANAGAFACLMVSKNSIVCTDQVRGSRYVFEAEIPEFTIRADTAPKLASFKPTHIAMSDAWVFFLNKEHNRTMGVRRIGVESVIEKINSLIENFTPIVSFPMPTELVEAVESMLILSSGESKYDHRMTMEAKDGTILCKTESVRGWVERSVAIDDKSIEFTVTVNPMLLSQVLPTVTTLNIGENMSCLRAGSFTHIMAHWNPKS